MKAKVRSLHYLFLLGFYYLATCSLTAQNLLPVNLNVKDAEYNTEDGLLYVLVGIDVKHCNSLVILDPSNGDVIESVQLETDPSVLTFSHDMKELYIGYRMINKLQKYDLESKQLETVLVFEDRKETNNGVQQVFYNGITDIVVISDNELLVSQASVQVNDPRKLKYVKDFVVEDEIEHAFNIVYKMVFDESSGDIYGTSKRNFMKFNFDGNSIEYFDSGSISDRQFGFEILGDTLVSASGKIYDISGQLPITLGTFFVNGSFSDGNDITLDLESNQLYLLESRNEIQSFYTTKLHVFDRKELDLIKSYDLGEAGRIKKIVYTGESGRFAIIGEFESNLSLMSNLFLISEKADCPIDIITISGTFETCKNKPETFIASGDSYKYIWSNQGEGKSISDSTSLEIFVRAFDESGCLVGESESYTIEREMGETGEIFGDSQRGICEIQETEIEAESRNADYFVWSTGEIGNSIFVSEEGEYSALAFQGAGCTDGIPMVFNLYNIYDESQLKPELTYSDSVYICEGEVLKVETNINEYQIEWTLGPDSNPNTFYGNQMTIGNFLGQSTDNDALICRARAILENGCKSLYSDPLYIFTNAIPTTQPSVLQKDSLLYVKNSVLYDSLAWFLNGQDLNLTGDSIIMELSGVYGIKTISDSLCYSNLKVAEVYISPNDSVNLETINIHCFIDFNQNGIQEPGDYNIEKAKLNLQPNNLTSSTDQEGMCRFYLRPDFYYLELNNDRPHFSKILGANGYNLFPNSNLDSTYLFTLGPDSIFSALKLMKHHATTRCNTLVPFWFTIENIGTETLDGELCLRIDPLISEIYNEGDLFSNTDDEMCFAFLDLRPSQIHRLRFDMQMPDETNTGTFIGISSYIKSNNSILDSLHFSSEIRCSYDPNDKIVTPSYNGRYALLKDSIDYTIRFQNTGNDTAFVVTLVDTLSSNLDWLTFEVNSASHPYEYTFNRRNGALDVVFQDINLVDSTSDFASSQGYFSFNIEPLSELEENEIIENIAEIYFDFNEPIITNTTSSEFVSSLDFDLDGWYFWEDCDDKNNQINPSQIEITNNGIDEDCDGSDINVSTISIEHCNEITLFPNPNSEFVYVKKNCLETLNYTIFNPQGIILIRAKLIDKINVLDLNPGLYYIRIRNESGLVDVTNKIVKI